MEIRMLPQKDLNPLWCSGEQSNFSWGDAQEAVGWWYSKRPLFLVGDSWIKERSSWQWTQQEDPRNLLTAEFSVQNKKSWIFSQERNYDLEELSRSLQQLLKTRQVRPHLIISLFFDVFLSFFVRLFNGMKHLRNVAS